MKTILLGPCIPLLGLLALSSACGRQQVVAATSRRADQEPPATGAGQLAPFQRELLQLAFAAASAFPLEPHRKNRSRAQERVVVACFELDQPDLALSFGRQIADWRRGGAYADYAWHRARAGDDKRALEYVGLAKQVIDSEAKSPDAQGWRQDLIALKIARVHRALGDDQAATAAAAGIDAGSTHALDGSWAATAADHVRALDLESAKRELATIDAGFGTLSLGQQGVALATVVRLHEQFFADTELRGACVQRVAATWTKVPPSLRLDALDGLLRISVAKGEMAAAKTLLATMRTLVAGHTWRHEDGLPQRARLVELAVAVGEGDRARAEAEAALADYHGDRDQIADIHRAKALRPLALAWFTLGDADQGHRLLALVVEEGMEDPNSRPRCDDLVDTCVALAKRRLEPASDLMARLREIQRGLGNPW